MAVDQGVGVSVPHPRENLAAAMSRVARQLQTEHGDVSATLEGITSSAVHLVPHAEHCGIHYVTGRRKVEPRAATGELPRTVDALQERLGEGPCLDAIWKDKVVRVDDVAGDGRWPTFSREGAGLGVGSLLCFQLFVEGDRLGALNLYATSPYAFDQDCLDIGQMLASHAAVALAGAEHEQHLRQAVTTRDLIGQAKGILMERYTLTADQAFGVLARVSQQTNRRLADVAAELTDGGVLPTS